jgi:HEAT repeat protein
VEITTREQVVTIDGIAAAPTMVIFDDGNRMLKTLAFAQPVAWLATQLANATDLWDREWAIGQLAHHVTDRAAADALTHAATTADHPLTRAQAAEALGEFPAGLAQDALLRATRDTASSVRTVAISALEKFGGDTVATAARQLFRTDPSYEVRAAALLTAVHTDPAHAHDLVAQAIVTPSYRDAIQNAAFQATIQLNDTSFIAQVDAAIASLEYPAHVLGVLGLRGNAHALALITSHLDDNRAGVRRYAVNAYGSTMARVDKAATLRQLRSALPGLTHPETRDAVAALIAQLEKP